MQNEMFFFIKSQCSSSHFGDQPVVADMYFFQPAMGMAILKTDLLKSFITGYLMHHPVTFLLYSSNICSMDRSRFIRCLQHGHTLAVHFFVSTILVIETVH